MKSGFALHSQTHIFLDTGNLLMAYKQQAELTNMIKTVRNIKKQRFLEATGTDLTYGMEQALLLQP